MLEINPENLGAFGNSNLEITVTWRKLRSTIQLKTFPCFTEYGLETWTIYPFLCTLCCYWLRKLKV